MNTYENLHEFVVAALAALPAAAHSLSQGWYSWRRTGDVARNFMTVTGGRDRLDRSVHAAGGPTLLARPVFFEKCGYVRA